MGSLTFRNPVSAWDIAQRCWEQRFRNQFMSCNEVGTRCSQTPGHPGAAELSRVGNKSCRPTGRGLRRTWGQGNELQLSFLVIVLSLAVVVGSAERHSMGDIVYSCVGKGLLHALHSGFDRRDSLSLLFNLLFIVENGCISTSQSGTEIFFCNKECLGKEALLAKHSGPLDI